jgi:trimeric autotransporter adhesin
MRLLISKELGMHRLPCTAGIMAALAATPALLAQCNWTTGFAPAGFAPENTEIWDATAAGSGSERALFVTGYFPDHGGYAVLRWNAQRWEQVGGNFTPFGASGLVEFDDGSGPSLWAWGNFTEIGGIAIPRLARFTGTEWTPVTQLITERANQIITGRFESGVDQSAIAILSSGRIYRWNTIGGWDPLPWTIQGTPMRSGSSAAIAAAHDGSAGLDQLFIAGRFEILQGGHIVRHNILRLDGDTWTPIGTVNTSSPVFRLLKSTRNPDGTGESLYLSGNFASINGTAAANIARWDGEHWHALGPGLPGRIAFDLAAADLPRESGLFLVTTSPNHLHRWTGDEFAPIGEPFDGMANKLIVAGADFDSRAGRGDHLFIAGSFRSRGQQTLRNLARFDGERFATITAGLDGPVHALAQDPFDPARIIAAGEYVAAAEQPIRRIAAWDGFAWTPLGQGANNTVFALAHAESGPLGPALYAGGGFTSVITSPALRIARWDGSSWLPLGGGMNDVVYALAIVGESAPPGPSGQTLYAGGWFTQAGGQPVSYIAAWDGSHWSDVGGGFNLAVRALAVYDADGSGPEPAMLHAGGHFTRAGSTVVNGIARWDGTAWLPLGDGIGGIAGQSRVLALHVHADRLIVAGTFSTAGGLPAANIARWDGAAWSPLGTGTNGPVHALSQHTADRGPELLIGGQFTTAGGFPAANLAAWNGSLWRAIEGGPNSPIFALASLETEKSVNRLFIGGSFTQVGSPAIPSHHFASTFCPTDSCYANCDGSIAPPVLNVDDFTCFINEFAAASTLPHPQQLTHYANCDGSTSVPVLNIDDFTCFINQFAHGCP